MFCAGNYAAASRIKGSTNSFTVNLVLQRGPEQFVNVALAVADMDAVFGVLEKRR